MQNYLKNHTFFLTFLLLLLLSSISESQLPSSPSLRITCTNGHITELSVTGNRTVKLTGRFSSDSFFTVLTKLSNLKTLSLISLGISGPLPGKIIRLSSTLQALNLSSNFISGKLPREISSLKNLRSLVLMNNLINGNVPDLRGLLNLQELNLAGNKLGPEIVPSLASNLIILSLKNNSFESKIPDQIKKLKNLQSLDLSINKLTGSIPGFLISLPSLQNLSLAQNLLSGSLPNSSLCNSKVTTLDVSRNLLTGNLPSCLVSKSFRNRKVIYSFNCLSLNGSPNAKYQRPVTFCENEANQAMAVKTAPWIKSLFAASPHQRQYLLP